MKKKYVVILLVSLLTLFIAAAAIDFLSFTFGARAPRNYSDCVAGGGKIVARDFPRLGIRLETECRFGGKSFPNQSLYDMLF